MLMRLTTACIAALASPAAGALAFTQESTFDWVAIEPTAELRYHDCYDGFVCARLKVPLDWNNADDNRTAAIAIAVIPAKVPSNHPDFGGTIITNPGGPGGSGVRFLQSYGQHIQKVLDGNKKYEILSFDPRGVGYTTPRADCFDDAFARDAWELEQRGVGPLDGGEDVLRRHLALVEGLGALCEATLGDSDIMRHITTAAVVRDMVEMVDRTDELRRKEAALQQMASRDNDQQPIQSIDEESKSDGVARIQYMGFSYGTALGITFASMYPGRVGRLVIDGVVDVQDYMSGSWVRNLMDTEAIVDYFYSACFDEGEHCPLRKASDQSGSDIKARVDKFIADVDESPISYVQDKKVWAVTGDDIRTTFTLSVYSPVGFFPLQAQVLADALEGNFSSFRTFSRLPRLQGSCSKGEPAVPYANDAGWAISCSDAFDDAKQSLGYYQDIIAFLKKQSITFGAWWARVPLRCLAARSRPKWRFPGPWKTPVADPTIKEGVPAAPVLLLSNRLDPVTPLVNAYRMSADHPGSAVVMQDAVGHCAIVSAWSDCTNLVLRDYFEHGTVPENGTVCESNCRPWQKSGCGMAMESTTAVDMKMDWHFHRRFPLGI